jgi:hypothetical protein
MAISIDIVLLQIMKIVELSLSTMTDNPNTECNALETNMAEFLFFEIPTLIL